MKKTAKVAVALLIAGVALALAGFAMAGFDFGNLNAGGALVERQYEAEGDVVELVVADRNADIVITPSEDGKARLTCQENEEAAYDIREEGGRLYIEKIEQRQNGLGAWFGFHLNGKLEIELPAGAHVDISNGNGAVRVDGGDGVSFPTVTIATDNGPIAVRNVSAGAVALGTDNDSVTVENVSADTLRVETDNGSIDLNGVQADDISLRTGNDNVRMEGVEADALEAVTDNGDVTFDGLTVRESLSLQTDNGDIRGQLPGEMRDYHIESETDYENNLPALLDSEGIFLRAVTNNGDIDVTFAE
ncbi:MAG TPA: DUF4097 family beta strand repeat protein [Candidatus Pullichristensenella excrementipullorum]|nr:DUF4097 family beta strand repeat protein [Candidatus Pullichristensenella excrementipullorum]